MRDEHGDADGGVRTVLLDAVRTTDEALRGIDRAERSASADARGELDRVRTEVRHATLMILESLLGTVEAETGRDGHARRVARRVRGIAAAMNLSPPDVIRLDQAARLHDVGELVLDWQCLAERRDLAMAERRALRRHPTIGERLLPTAGLDPDVCRIVGAHHERLDGSGYPDRLVGRDLPLGARILAVAETYEALVHPRPHRAEIDPNEALQHLRREANAGRLDRLVVDRLAETAEGSTGND